MIESLASNCAAGSGEAILAYDAMGDAVIGRNGGRFNNRPIYSNNHDDVIIGGDRPIIRLGQNPFLYGTSMIGVVRGMTALWLHDALDIRVSYRAGRLSWQIRDERIAGVTFHLDLVPIVARTGMVMRMRIEGAKSADVLVWTFGGAMAGINPNSFFDVVVSEQIAERGFVAADCVDNVVIAEAASFRIICSLTACLTIPERSSHGCVVGRCSSAMDYSVVDAGKTDQLAVLGDTRPGNEPLAYGKTIGFLENEIFFGVLGRNTDDEPNVSLLGDLSGLFTEGWQRGEELARRVIVSTPEHRLDALASVSTAAIDGTWYPPVFVHGAMLWNIPFPGWRTICGATAYGWHERVAQTARYFIASQIQVSALTAAEADPERLLTMQSENSRFYGKGRITAHAGFYDMQSQFFDQLVTEWRWNPEPEYEKILRPALDLHLEWMQECFDPDGDGAYESYINAWPTDSVWYNGGGSCEATSYAFRGHQAAYEMAKRAADVEKECWHAEVLARIRKGFFEQLWVHRLGHPGKYREQGGSRRLHENPWLYALFLPIDAGLLSPAQAASTLNYSWTSLQNDVKPGGGRMVWNSNWVPAIWSTRTDWPGDNYALALAHFQAGFANEGWDIFKGTFLTSAYSLSCPGNLGHRVGGCDFGDCSHPFARTLVEGLFGYQPDYPNAVVRLRPQFPAEWNNASIRIADASLIYSQHEDIITYEVELAFAAALEIQIPIRAIGIVQVQANGRPVDYQVLPGMNCGILQVDLPSCRRTSLAIQVAEVLSAFSPYHLSGEVGQQLTVNFDEGQIENFSDPQGIFQDHKVSFGKLKGTLAANPGHHVLLPEVRIGSVLMLRVVHLTIKDSANVAARASMLLSKGGTQAKWRMIDLDEQFNSDIRQIFKQKYLSPRPNTVSVRLGIDGWTPWTSTFWKQNPPEIDLENVPHLSRGTGIIDTPQGIPFKWKNESNNIAFASQWDNFPAAVTVPVDGSGEAIWLLVAGSTNPMQCEIANAVIRLEYSDGGIQNLELIPPTNFWALAPIGISGSQPGQEGRFDYSDPIDAYCVPPPHPALVELGTNCRAMLYGMSLRADVRVTTVNLEVLSQDVVIGLMGVSIMNPRG